MKNLLLLSFSLLFFLSAEPAHAYLDPGSGSFIFQIIIGTVLGSMFALKTYFRGIKRFISGRLRRKNEKK